MSVSRRRRVVYACPDCMTVAEAYHLKELGRKVRAPFREANGDPCPGVVIREVLCWWCREKHSPEEVESCMKIPERKASSTSGTGSSLSASDAGLLTQFSEILAFLGGTPLEGGPERRPGTLSLKWESGLWGVTLNDQQTAQYAFLQGRSLDDVLLTIEGGLSDGSLPWRVSNRVPGKRR